MKIHLGFLFGKKIQIVLSVRTLYVIRLAIVHRKPVGATVAVTVGATVAVGDGSSALFVFLLQPAAISNKQSSIKIPVLFFMAVPFLLLLFPIIYYQSAFPYPYCQFRAVAEAGFSFQGLNVAFYRSEGHAKLFGNSGVGFSRHHLTKHLQLPLGEVLAYGGPKL